MMRKACEDDKGAEDHEKGITYDEEDKHYDDDQDKNKC